MQHAAVPVESFQKIMNVLGSLPYVQVGPLMQELDGKVALVDLTPQAAPDQAALEAVE